MRWCHIVSDLQQRVMPNLVSGNKVIHNVNKLLCHFHADKTLIALLAPSKLGPLIPNIAKPKNAIVSHRDTYNIVTPAVQYELWKAGITDVVVSGVQTEWCVMQTSQALRELGFRVHVPVDATTTQDEHEHRVALRRMQQMGVLPVTTHGLIAESLSTTKDERSRAYVKSIARQKAEAAIAGAG